MQTYAEYRPTGFDRRGLNARNMGPDEDEDRSAWLVLPVVQTRDSGPLDRSNFRSAVRELGGEGEDVEVHRFGHWGPGWFEIVIVRPDTAAASTAEEIAGALEDYPIVDEDDHSALECETACEVWRGFSIRDRVVYCQRYGANIFAARRDELPEDETGELIGALAE